jgi:hypothetical protein
MIPLKGYPYPASFISSSKAIDNTMTGISWIKTRRKNFIKLKTIWLTLRALAKAITANHLTKFRRKVKERKQKRRLGTLERGFSEINVHVIIL